MVSPLAFSESCTPTRDVTRGRAGVECREQRRERRLNERMRSVRISIL